MMGCYTQLPCLIWFLVTNYDKNLYTFYITWGWQTAFQLRASHIKVNAPNSGVLLIKSIALWWVFMRLFSTEKYIGFIFNTGDSDEISLAYNNSCLGAYKSFFVFYSTTIILLINKENVERKEWWGLAKAFKAFKLLSFVCFGLLYLLTWMNPKWEILDDFLYLH